MSATIRPMLTQGRLHIVTGGTGFVGSAIILELLRTTDARIIGLTRPDAGADAKARLHGALEQAARLYGHDAGLDHAIASRCEAVAADLHEAHCGVAPSSEWAGAELWHCAASLQFLDRYEQAIFKTNVEGSRNVAALAGACGVEIVNMISTAYVAGTRSGTIREAPVEVMDAGANNHYERSKIAAEQVFADSDLACVRVLRPSIVIGHSQTRAALNFNGLYGFLRSIYKFRRLMERTQREFGDTLEVRMVADAAGTLDMIPVDHVAHDAVAVSRAGAGAGYFHLTNPRPPATRHALEIMFAAAGMRAPSFVDDREAFTWLDRKFNDRVDFYNAYLVGPKQFVRANTDRWVPSSPSHGFELDDERLAEFCRWYVEGPLTQRKALPETR